MYAQADNQRLMPKPRPMLPPNRMQSAKQPAVKAPPSKMILSSMEPASAGAIARAHLNNQMHPNTTFFTPHQAAVANRMGIQNNPLGHFGDSAENFLQLKQMGQEAAGMFNPRTKGGIANIASLFAGGPEGLSEGDVSANFERSMPGQFEKYSITKAANGGHLSSDQMLQSVVHDAWVARNHPNPEVRMQALQRLHDQLFGGEVHAKGEIPGRPSEASMEALNANRAKVREQLRQERLAAFNRRAAERQQQPGYDAAAARKFIESQTFQRHGIDPRVQTADRVMPAGHPLQDPTVETDMGISRNNRGGDTQHAYDALGLHAQRQEALQRFYRQQAHNHRN